MPSAIETVRRETIRDIMRLIGRDSRRDRLIAQSAVRPHERRWDRAGRHERAYPPPPDERCMAVEGGVRCIRRRAGRKYCAEHRVPMRRARQRERYTGAARRRIQRQARAAAAEQAALKRRWNAMLERGGGERLSELEWRELLRWKGRQWVRDELGGGR